MKLSREINPSGNEATKVTITEDTTIEQLKLYYPMLDVLEDSDGLYIRTRYCRFLPGSSFFASPSGVPTFYCSATL